MPRLTSLQTLTQTPTETHTHTQVHFPLIKCFHAETEFAFSHLPLSTRMNTETPSSMFFSKWAALPTAAGVFRTFCPSISTIISPNLKSSHWTSSSISLMNDKSGVVRRPNPNPLRPLTSLISVRCPRGRRGVSFSGETSHTPFAPSIWKDERVTYNKQEKVSWRHYHSSTRRFSVPKNTKRHSIPEECRSSLHQR